jgi:hypothetical protein
MLSVAQTISIKRLRLMNKDADERSYGLISDIIQHLPGESESEENHKKSVMTASLQAEI